MPIARKYRSIIDRPKRPTLAGLILEKVAEAGEVLLDGFFPAKYPEARLWRTILALDDAYEFKRATFGSILSQLQARGLVERHVKTKRSFWRITAKGRKTSAAPPPSRHAHGDGKQRVVCFDIPERDRTKRRWLRSELLALGYRPLQKSVWIGASPLPVEFIEALDALELRERVHVLRIEDEGTLHGRHSTRS